MSAKLIGWFALHRIERYLRMIYFELVENLTH